MYPTPKIENIQYLGQADKELMVKYSKDSLTLIVALHELLGHGTGKLFTQDAETGELNYDKEIRNPFTDEEITTQYLSTETWSQKFGKLHSGYEECRADSVALHLINFAKPYQIFFDGRTEEWDDIFYICWLDILYGAIKGLQFFNTEKKQWMQAHILASWAIFAAVREGDPELIKIDFFKTEEGKDSFTFSIDRSKLRGTGFQALSDFLHKLHVYKSIGDYASAEKFFNHYSEVDEVMLKVREIVIANKIPRRLELQPNILLKKDTKDEVEYHGYADNFEGVIQSYLDRFDGWFQRDVYEEWLANADKMRYQ